MPPRVSARGDQWIGVVVQAVEDRVVDPRVLDELVLPRQVADQAQEVQAALVPVVGRVAPGPAQQPVVVGQPQRPLAARLRRQRVARVGPPDMRAERACQALRVFGVVAEVGEGGVRVVGVRGQHQRGAAAPPADHLRGEPLLRRQVLGAPRGPGALAEERREGLDVLAELAHHQVAAAESQVRGPGAGGVAGQDPLRVGRGVEQGSRGELVVGVGVAEHELAGRDRPAGAPPGQPGQPRLREAVDEPERLPVPQLVRAQLRDDVERGLGEHRAALLVEDRGVAA